MKSRKDIKNAVLPHLAQNEGMAERIQNRLGFAVVWSRLDYEETLMVYYACQVELGHPNANSALSGMMVYRMDDHCSTRLSPPA